MHKLAHFKNKSLWHETSKGNRIFTREDSQKEAKSLKGYQLAGSGETI